MSFVKIKRISGQLTKSELGLVKYLTGHSCARSFKQKLSDEEANLFKGFYSDSSDSFLAAVAALEKHKMVIHSPSDDNDLILTEFGLSVGGYNGANERVLASEDLVEWYNHQKIF